MSGLRSLPPATPAAFFFKWDRLSPFAPQRQNPFAKRKVTIPQTDPLPKVLSTPAGFFVFYGPQSPSFERSRRTPWLTKKHPEK